MWQKHIMDIERMKDWWISNFSIEAYNVKKLNPYWVEYHYFTQEIVKALSKYQSDLNVSKILKEIFEGYLSNSDKLTERLKKDKVMWPVNGLGSDIYSKMEQYYFEINNKEKLKEIWEKAEKQGWRVAFFYKEEDDEENDE